MKRLLFVLVMFLLVTVNVSAASFETPISSSDLDRIGQECNADLHYVDRLPDGIVPIQVNSIDELRQVIVSRDGFIEQSALALQNMQYGMAYRDDSAVVMSTPGTPVVTTNTITLQDIVPFRLDTMVNFTETYYTWFGGELINDSIVNSINWHEVVAVRALAVDWILSSKTATISSDCRMINGNVRGICQQYINVPATGVKWIVNSWIVDQNFWIDAR